MATKTVAWNSGSGVITLTYTGQGNGSVSVKSDANDSFDARSQNLNIVTTEGSPEKAVQVLVKQAGKPLGWASKNFEYTGSVQEVTLPKGRYKLQCWGAQGGSVTGTYAATGSKGGYSEGIITLTETTTLYIFVGGQGTSYTSSASQTSTAVLNGGWNGGGAGVRTTRYNNGGTDGRSFPRSGGGATDIALVTSSMSYANGRTDRSSESLLSRIIVAGGGAGASSSYTNVTETTTNKELAQSNESPYFKNETFGSSGLAWIYWDMNDLTDLNGKTIVVRVAGGSASRLTYLNITKKTTSAVGNREILKQFAPAYIGNEYEYTIATDTPYGLDIYTEVSGTSGESTSGIVPYICEVYIKETTTNITESNEYTSGSQQGGGVYGKGTYPGYNNLAVSGGAFGIGANVTKTNSRYAAGAGGGGWYGGGTDASSTNPLASINACGGGSGFVNVSSNAGIRPSGYTGLQLDSGSTTAGNSSHPSVSGSTEVGHSGNGYARITVIN